MLYASRRDQGLVQRSVAKRRKTAELNFHDNKFLRRRLYVRRTRGSPDFLFLFSKKRKCYLFVIRNKISKTLNNPFDIEI